MAAEELDWGPLSCAVCCNKFDLKEHRPKILTCGHTCCLQCLERIRHICPMCRRPFEEDSLMDNYQLCQFVGDGPYNMSRPSAVSQRPLFWCGDCKSSSSESCVNEECVMGSLGKLHVKLAKSADDARQVVATLERLSSEVESFRGTIQRLETAHQGLDARVLEGLEDEVAPPKLTIDSSWDLKSDDDDSLMDPRLDQVTELTNVYCDRYPAWSEALLRKVAWRLRQLEIYNPTRRHLQVVQGMRRLRALRICSYQAPNGIHPLPRSLEEVHLVLHEVSKELLLDLHELPRLRALCLHVAEVIPGMRYPLLPQGRGLRFLRVIAGPPSTWQPLVRAHAATLEELWLSAPASLGYLDFPNLIRHLVQSEMAALRRFVLNVSCMRYRDVRRQRCSEERRLMTEAGLRALSDREVEVLCSTCSPMGHQRGWVLHQLQ